jgi:hypothetical protein
MVQKYLILMKDVAQDAKQDFSKGAVQGAYG